MTPVQHRIPPLSPTAGSQACRGLSQGTQPVLMGVWQDTNVCVHSKPHLSQASLGSHCPLLLLCPFVKGSTKLHWSTQLWDTNLALGFSSLSPDPALVTKPRDTLS